MVAVDDPDAGRGHPRPVALSWKRILALKRGASFFHARHVFRADATGNIKDPGRFADLRGAWSGNSCAWHRAMAVAAKVSAIAWWNRIECMWRSSSASQRDGTFKSSDVMLALTTSVDGRTKFDWLASIVGAGSP